jgi:FtsP/CotA-like multicopper oxidase with cupredoxin domain
VPNPTTDRRALLKLAGMAPLIGFAPRFASASDQVDAKADYILRIATGLVELSPEHIVSTTLYNGQFPGPLLRFSEGQRVVIDIHNETDTPEQVHWHGQRRTACVRSRSCRGRQAFASSTRTSWLAPI